MLTAVGPPILGAAEDCPVLVFLAKRVGAKVAKRRRRFATHITVMPGTFPLPCNETTGHQTEVMQSLTRNAKPLSTQMDTDLNERLLPVQPSKQRSWHYTQKASVLGPASPLGSTPPANKAELCGPRRLWLLPCAHLFAAWTGFLQGHLPSWH